MTALSWSTMSGCAGRCRSNFAGSCRDLPAFFIFSSADIPKNKTTLFWVSGKPPLPHTRGIPRLEMRQYYLLCRNNGFVEIFPNRAHKNCEREPLTPQEWKATHGDELSMTPGFDLFFGCTNMAMLHGARVDRPRAPVVPSLRNTLPRRFSTQQK